ncbi:alpha-D-ribose 1-methylphosphonate 5-triphosphate diphosphatase [Anabaena cylindrica FACHB-243]|nr:alpha-D-ribose 1-methylphosphonate 5-triphosphate diphosphatase [Anabaena cylindrica FACHB-243]
MLKKRGKSVLSTTKLAIQAVDILTPNGWIPDATVLIENGKFINIDQTITPPEFPVINAKGLQMLPGIIDLHGDAFERMICPRPGVNFPLPMAIADNDRNLIASGITTFFCSITDSYEPGLRSRDSARSLIDFILGIGKQVLSCNHQIHIRHEEANTKNHDELCNWLESGKINLISINDHLPPAGDEAKLKRLLKGLRQRIALSEPEITELLTQTEKNRHQGYEQVEELIAIAHSHKIPVASHDDDCEEKVALSQRRQIAIAEFPASIPLAAKSRYYGAAVLMGAPNLVRGGSHVGYMSVAEATKHGVLDCLCSDYHYPSLFHAPFKLQELGLMSFEEAWKLVSSHPAAASGIGNYKGQISPGLDADFLLISPHNSLHSAISSVYIGGKEVAKYQ